MLRLARTAIKAGRVKDKSLKRHGRTRRASVKGSRKGTSRKRRNGDGRGGQSTARRTKASAERFSGGSGSGSESGSHDSDGSGSSSDDIVAHSAASSMNTGSSRENDERRRRSVLPRPAPYSSSSSRKDPRRRRNAESKNRRPHDRDRHGSDSDSDSQNVNQGSEHPRRRQRRGQNNTLRNKTRSSGDLTSRLVAIDHSSGAHGPTMSEQSNGMPITHSLGYMHASAAEDSDTMTQHTPLAPGAAMLYSGDDGAAVLRRKGGARSVAQTPSRSRRNPSEGDSKARHDWSKSEIIRRSSHSLHSDGGQQHGLKTEAVPKLGRRVSARSVLPKMLVENEGLTMATTGASDTNPLFLAKLRTEHRSSSASAGGANDGGGGVSGVGNTSVGGAQFPTSNTPKRPWHGEIDEEEMWYLSRLSKTRDRKADVDRMRAGRPALLGAPNADGSGMGGRADSCFESNDKSSPSNNNSDDAKGSASATDLKDDDKASPKSSSDMTEKNEHVKEEDKAPSASTDGGNDRDAMPAKTHDDESALLQILLSKDVEKRAHFATAWARVEGAEARSRITALTSATSRLEGKLRDQELEIDKLERALAAARVECGARNTRMRERLERVARLEMTIKTGWSKTLETRKESNKMELSNFERSFHRALMDKLDKAQQTREQGVADTMKRVQSSLRQTKRAHAQSLRSGIIVRAVATSAVVLLRCVLFCLGVLMPLLWVCGGRKTGRAGGGSGSGSDSRLGRTRALLQRRLDSIEAFRNGEGEDM